LCTWQLIALCRKKEWKVFLEILKLVKMPIRFGATLHNSLKKNILFKVTWFLQHHPISFIFFSYLFDDIRDHGFNLQVDTTHLLDLFQRCEWKDVTRWMAKIQHLVECYQEIWWGFNKARWRWLVSWIWWKHFISLMFKLILEGKDSGCNYGTLMRIWRFFFTHA
jgi:hypothetical protein